MKKADLKAGVMLGFANSTSDYRTARPVILLDAKTLWTWVRRDNKYIYQASPATRYESSAGSWSTYYGDHGYLTLMGSSRATPMDAQLAQMNELYKEFAATAGDADAVNGFVEKIRNLEDSGIRIDVVNNRWISGPYEEAKTAEAERDRVREVKRKAEIDRANVERDFLAEIAEKFSDRLEHSVSIRMDRDWGEHRASISFADLAEFFGLKGPKDRL